MPQTEILPSARVVIQAPMSFHGSWIRSWRLVDYRGKTSTMPAGAGVVAALGLIAVGLGLVAVWWLAVAAWYCVFGLLLVPYRLIRRGSRKRKMENLRHRELLNTMQ